SGRTSMGTSTGIEGQPNVMFVLDASGSMERDYVPDTVNPTTSDVFASRTLNDTYTCRSDNNGINLCSNGEPPFNAGQFNGMAYNPLITYKAAVNSDGTPRADHRTYPAVPNDSFAANPTYVDLTKNFPEIGYCPSGGACTPRRNGIHNGTRFAYATPPKPAIPVANVQSVVRSNSTVTVTTKSAHNVQVGDVIDVTGPNVGGCAATAAQVATVPSAITFTYIYRHA